MLKLLKKPQTKQSAESRSSSPDWLTAFGALQVNVMIANADLQLIYVNSRAKQTLRQLREPIDHQFHVDVDQLIGKSIHTFHTDPQRVERILFSDHQLPHEAEFSFGEITLSTKIDALRDEEGNPQYFIVTWDDISERVKREQEVSRLMNMVENMPTNIMFADRDLVIRYLNPASRRTLQKLEHLLPIPVDSMVGASIDHFHTDPSYQRQLLANPDNLPVKSQIKVGNETLSLLVTAIRDQNGVYIGSMATWDIVTEKVQLQQGASQLSQSVASSSTELAASVEEISRSIQKTSDLAQQAERVASGSRQSVLTLRESSKDIEKILALIHELAEQTNLLALNATIEAARAGESGKGFAVVASEIKNLARETGSATESIQSSVDGIRSSIHGVVGSIDEITQSVAEVNLNTSTVASAIEEQTVTMQELSRLAERMQAFRTDLEVEN